MDRRMTHAAAAVALVAALSGCSSPASPIPAGNWQVTSLQTAEGLVALPQDKPVVATQEYLEGDEGSLLFSTPCNVVNLRFRWSRHSITPDGGPRTSAKACMPAETMAPESALGTVLDAPTIVVQSRGDDLELVSDHGRLTLHRT